MAPKTFNALLNSDGWLEFFCNQGRADKLAKAKLGNRVEVRVPQVPSLSRRGRGRGSASPLHQAVAGPRSVPPAHEADMKRVSQLSEQIREHTYKWNANIYERHYKNFPDEWTMLCVAMDTLDDTCLH